MRIAIAAAAACIGAGMWLTAAPAQACAMSDTVCLGLCQSQLAKSGQATPENIVKVCADGKAVPGGPNVDGGGPGPGDCHGILGQTGAQFTGRPC
jgi:hypothetical protein